MKNSISLFELTVGWLNKVGRLSNERKIFPKTYTMIFQYVADKGCRLILFYYIFLLLFLKPFRPNASSFVQMSIQLCEIISFQSDASVYPLQKVSAYVLLEYALRSRDSWHMIYVNGVSVDVSGISMFGSLLRIFWITYKVTFWVIELALFHQS